MSGVDYIADTNAVVYLLAGNSCMEPFLGKKLAVSVITVMELLSFPEIDEKEETIIRNFLNNCEILNISEGIRELTIEIRRTYKTKETLINSAVPVHANNHILYNRNIKNTGAEPHESTIFQ